jgi:hypothetical protein
MGSVEDTLVYPGRLKIVKQDGRPVHRVSERGGEPSIGIQWDVWCGHPHCRRVFGRLLRVISRFPTYRLELDSRFAQLRGSPGIWHLSSKIARTHSGQPRRARVLPRFEPDMEIQWVRVGGRWMYRKLPRGQDQDTLSILTPFREPVRNETGRVISSPHLIHGSKLPIIVICDRATQQPHRTEVSIPPDPLALTTRQRGWRPTSRR